jgi:carboxypeptidase PM20D1
MKKLLIVIALVIVLVVVVLGVIAGIQTARFASKQPPAEPAVQIAVDADAAAQHLAGAIRFATVSYEEREKVDRAPFLALAGYIESAYPTVHTLLQREVINQLSLLYTWSGREAQLDPIVLMGHLDVVPVVPGTEGQWTHPPFAGEIADGYVWGRGAGDNKNSVIAVLEAVEKLAGEGYQPRRTIYLAFGHDEEVGGPEGARKIADALQARGVSRFAFVTDEGGGIGKGLVPGIDRPTALIGIAEKGYLNLQLRVEGEGGHSSMPPAETSIGILSRAVARLEATPFPARLDGPARQMFEYLGPEMAYGPKLAMANLWLLRPIVEREMLKNPQSAALLRTTTAPTIFHAGVKPNVLAPEATAMVNFRIKPGETMASVEAFVRTVIGDSRVKMSRYADGKDPSPVSDVTSPAFAMMTKTMRQVLPADVVISPMLVAGGTDAKYYSVRSPNVFRFLPAVLTAEDLRRFHGTNERMSVDNLATSVKYFYQLVKNLDGM